MGSVTIDEVRLTLVYDIRDHGLTMLYQKRKAVYIDLAIGVGIPVLQLIAGKCPRHLLYVTRC